MKDRGIIGSEELTGMILPYIVLKPVLWSKAPYHKKYKDSVREEIKLYLDRIKENSFSRQFEKEYVYTNFPFLYTEPEEYKVTEEFLDEVLSLGYILNDYAKYKVLTPKETRTFYEAKNRLICLIYSYWKSKITEVWSENVEGTDSFYVCFRIKYKSGDDIVFHQPFKNVSSLFKTKEKREDLLNNSRPYGRKGCFKFSFNKNEEKVMRVAYNIFLIYMKVLEMNILFKSSEKEEERRNGNSR